MVKRPKYLNDYTEEDWDKINSDLNGMAEDDLSINKYQVETLLHYTNAGVNPGAVITLKKRLDRINRALKISKPA